MMCIFADDFPVIVVGVSVGTALSLLAIAAAVVLVCARLNSVRRKGYTTPLHGMHSLFLLSLCDPTDLPAPAS